MNYDYKIAPNIVNLAVARPSMAVGRGTGGLSPPVPLQTTPTNQGEMIFKVFETDLMRTDSYLKYEVNNKFSRDANGFIEILLFFFLNF